MNNTMEYKRYIGSIELSETDAVVFVVFLEFSFSVIFPHPSSCHHLCESTTFTVQFILSNAHFSPDYCGLPFPPQPLAPTDSGSDSWLSQATSQLSSSKHGLLPSVRSAFSVLQLPLLFSSSYSA